MKTKTQILLVGAVAAAVATTLFTGCASSPTQMAQTYKMTTPIAPGVAVPDKIEASIGTLNLNYGYPSDATTQKVYDNLDASRALQAYLLAIPIVSQVAMRDAIRQYVGEGPANAMFENLTDSKSVQLTANDNTIYNFIWTDTHKGPVVLEVPPMSLGLIDDLWYKWVADIGITGADQGKGGKYLVLPPGYKGEIPEGYFVVRPNTYGTWTPFRTFLVKGQTQPAVEEVKKTFKTYPLAEAANPPAVKFVNVSGIPTTFLPPGDYAFWGLLNKAIQEEPSEGGDATTLGFFAAIGIEKGKPFNPDARMKKILADAANIGAVTARALIFKIRDQDAYIYPGHPWRLPFFGGYKFESAPGVANLDGAAFFFYFATGVTPAMAEKMVGKGSQYPWCAQDSQGNPFEGGKNYKLHLPPNIPAKDFWSIIIYDNQTRSMVQTDQQFPSVSSQNKDLQVNADGSVDVYFGPKAPAGKESNWMQTIPGKGWFMCLRLYGPLEPWFDQTWRPDDIKLVK